MPKKGSEAEPGFWGHTPGDTDNSSFQNIQACSLCSVGRKVQKATWKGSNHVRARLRLPPGVADWAPLLADVLQHNALWSEPEQVSAWVNDFSMVYDTFR